MAEEDECAVDDDDMDEDEAGAEPEVVHLQEIVEGLWVGDLVAAMDTEGLKARGIVRSLSSHWDTRAIYPSSPVGALPRGPNLICRPISYPSSGQRSNLRPTLPSSHSRSMIRPIQISSRTFLRASRGLEKPFAVENGRANESDDHPVNLSADGHRPRPPNPLDHLRLL